MYWYIDFCQTIRIEIERISTFNILDWWPAGWKEPFGSCSESGRYLCVAVSAGDPKVPTLGAKGGGVQNCVIVDSKLLVHLRASA